jgi:hypothetical protein
MQPDARYAVEFEFHPQLAGAMRTDCLDVCRTPHDATARCACHLRPDWERVSLSMTVTVCYLCGHLRQDAKLSCSGRWCEGARKDRTWSVRRASCQVAVLVQQRSCKEIVATVLMVSRCVSGRRGSHARLDAAACEEARPLECGATRQVQNFGGDRVQL